jgi:hypothetical protein
MRPRAERPAGIDDDREGVRRRRLPRWPDPEAPDADALVEAPPRVLPALRHVLRDHDVEAQRRLVGVDRVGAFELLDALREDVEQQRELRLAADDDVPLQRKALLSLPRKPPSSP